MAGLWKLYLNAPKPAALSRSTNRRLRVERLEDRRLLAAANLVISEFMATNVTKLADVTGEYPDWIEIRNLGSTSVNLIDYSLTDNDSNLQKWSFPSTTLAAGGYLVVFASQPLDANGQPINNYIDSASKLHTNFKLDSEGEYLALAYEDPVSHAISVVHEYADFPEQYPDYSFGIASDSQYRYFSTTTPGTANGAGLQGVVADTKFSVDRGFYNTPFSLTLSTTTAGATIRYTTNGSAPTATSGTVYSGPITIDKTSVIRAIAYQSGYVPTNVDTQTYLFLNDIVNQTHAQAIAQGFPVNWREPPQGSLVVAEHGMDPQVIGTFTNGVPNGNDNYGGIYASQIFDSLTSIPTISLVMSMTDLFNTTTGIYANSTLDGVAWERAGSVEWITPGNDPEFQVDAGVRIQGGAFRSDFYSEKHSFRLLFKDQYGPSELTFPLFGDDATSTFETVVLRTSTNDGYAWNAQPTTRQYARDEFGRSLQLDMGAPSPRNNYAHLYINGQYWGVYAPTERPDAEFAASYLGYNPDNTDVIHDNEANEGDFVAWDTMVTIASTANSATTTSRNNYMKLQGLGNTGLDDPTLPAYLDVDNYIDYLLINAWGGNDDWPHHNFWAARDQDPTTSEGFQFFIWDFEGTMGNTRGWSPLDTRTFDQGWNDVRTLEDNNAGRMHHFLKTNPEYQLDFADRVHKWFFNNGIFTPANLLARYQEIADRVKPYIVAESARWGDMHATVPLTLEEWETEYEWMTGEINPTAETYLLNRTSYVMDELEFYNLYPSIVAPTFSQHGGQVAAGYDLTMTAPAGTIYYMTDGSDPRLIGGALNPAAQVYTGAAIDIAAAKTVKARVRSGSTWSALNEAAFTVAPPASALNLAITELNFNPHAPNPIPGMGELAVDSQEYEFIELRNISNETIDLTGVAFSEVAVEGAQEGMAFTFGTRMLAPGENVLIVENLAAFQSRYGAGLNVAGEYSGKLANGGELLTLRAAGGALIASFAYDDEDGWPTRADGAGSSLEIFDPAGDYEDPLNWRASGKFGGSPGTVGGGSQFDVVINEVLSHSDGASLDLVELFNSTGAAIDLSGWYLSDVANSLAKFEFANGTVLAAGAYFVVNQTQLGYALDGQFGDSLRLVAANPTTGVPLRFADAVEFDATATDVSLGRWFNGDGGSTMFPTKSSSFGAVNSGPRTGDVVVTEVHYHAGAVPVAEQANITQDELEFLELTNVTASAKSVANWSVDGIDFTFAAGVTLAAGESVVIVTFNPTAQPAKATAFRNVFGISGGARLFGPAGGRLDNAGEQIKLLRPEDPVTLATGDILVDSLRYDELAPWPAVADGAGQSLQRFASAAYGNFTASWRAALPTPGTFVAVSTGDFNSDGFANGLDFLTWQRNLGNAAASRASGDGDFDGDVDAQDLAVWRVIFGQPVAEQLAATVAATPAAVLAPSQLVDIALAVSQSQDAIGEQDELPWLPEEVLAPVSTPQARHSDDFSGDISPAATIVNEPRDDESVATSGFAPWDDALDAALADLI